MKIAQLAPPWLPVPPKGYGGTETVIHNLTEGLIKKGHEVTLFASGDSKTSAKLHYVFKEAIGNSGKLKNNSLPPLLHYIECFERAEEFDIIHNHAQYYAMFLAHLVKTPVVHTLHGSYSPEYTPEGKILTLNKFKNHNYVSISNSQRHDLEGLNYVATVYNGVDLNFYEFSEKSDKYLLWIGRVSPKKGLLEAIQVAKRLNMRLKIAAVIDPIDRPYFEIKIHPLIDNNLITFEGEVAGFDKVNLYKNAYATLYPIDWNEPFGLVMAESMACGTPVVAYNRGSVPEIVVSGKTGFIVNNLDEMASVIGKIDQIDRKACRIHVEENFTVEKMVDGYEKVYQKVINR